ncbi:hypothetical protein JYT74_02855 [Crocinitomix catalasitica]|nr:hypothetical protein [Crocinitomix catalasitica]
MKFYDDGTVFSAKSEVDFSDLSPYLGSQNNSMLQYGKLYQSLKKVSGEWHQSGVHWEHIWFYYRFFENNTLIFTSVGSEDHKAINSWFDKDYSDGVTGTFDIKSNGRIAIVLNNVEVQAAVTKEGHLIIHGHGGWDLYKVID